MFAEIKQSLHDFGVDFDVYFHENSLHESGAVDKAVVELQGIRAALLRRRRLVAADRPSSVTTRTGWSSRATASRPTSPATSPTCATSARAASTCASTCSAPTTTATSAGSRRPPRRSATTRTSVEVLIGQLVNLVKDGAAGPDEQAGRHRDHPRGPRRRGRRRRRPLRPRAVVDRLDARPRPRPADAGAATTTRSSTCSTRTPARRAVAAQPRPASASGSTRLRARAARPRARDRSARRARRVPAGRRQRRPSCASRTGSPATSKTSPAPTTAGTTPAGCCRIGDEPVTDLNRTRVWLNDATRIVLANGLGLLGVSAPERM